MGHLINPIAMRIGWFSNWCDSWFSEFHYYPELLHEIFKIRLYISYFFSLKFIEKSSLFLSHVEIFYQAGFLFTRFFYYNSSIFFKLEDFFQQLREYILTARRRKFFLQRGSKGRRRYHRRKRGIGLSSHSQAFFFFFSFFLSFYDLFSFLWKRLVGEKIKTLGELFMHDVQVFKKKKISFAKWLDNKKYEEAAADFVEKKKIVFAAKRDVTLFFILLLKFFNRKKINKCLLKIIISANCLIIIFCWMKNIIL